MKGESEGIFAFSVCFEFSTVRMFLQMPHILKGTKKLLWHIEDGKLPSSTYTTSVTLIFNPDGVSANTED